MSDQTKPIRPPHLQVVVHFRQESRVFPLPVDGIISVGRATGNTIVLDEPAVSGQHALLSSDAEQVTIEHTGNQGDTFLARNSAIAAGAAAPLALLAKHHPVPIAIGDSLRIGGAVLSLEASAASSTGATSATAPPLSPSETPAVVLDPVMLKAYELVTRAAATERPRLRAETGGRLNRALFG